MEDLATALFYDTVPDTWVARAYPSMMGLAAWYADLLLRIRVRPARSRCPDSEPPAAQPGPAGTSSRDPGHRQPSRQGPVVGGRAPS